MGFVLWGGGGGRVRVGGGGGCLCCVYFLASNCLWDPVCFIVEAKFVGLILL